MRTLPTIGTTLCVPGYNVAVRIFISHNVNDKDTARMLATMFTDRGIGVWFGQWEIKPGDSITGGIGRGIEECDVFMLMWSAAAKASKWVGTELRRAIRKRADDTGFRLIPIVIDDTALPALVGDYRGSPLKKVSDIEGIVRAFCPELEIDIVARLQQRFLELVAKQFPEATRFAISLLPGMRFQELECADKA